MRVEKIRWKFQSIESNIHHKKRLLRRTAACQSSGPKLLTNNRAKLRFPGRFRCFLVEILIRFSGLRQVTFPACRQSIGRKTVKIPESSAFAVPIPSLCYTTFSFFIHFFIERFILKELVCQFQAYPLLKLRPP